MPSIKIKLFKGKTLKDGSHPLVLQIIHNRNVRKIGLDLSSKPDEWIEELSRFSNNHKNFRSKNKVLSYLEDKAEKILLDIVREGKPFSIELFKSRFSDKSTSIGVLEAIYAHSQELKAKQKLSTSDSYRSTWSVLGDFTKGQDITFHMINYEFLINFESFLFQRGCSEGGVNHHMRNLRATFNRAIRNQQIEYNYYPFSNALSQQGYSLSRVKSKAKPRALSELDLKKLKDFPQDKHPDLIDSYYLFMFSYYARGMNFTDMALLKKVDIKGDRINYVRKKTGTQFSIKLSSRMHFLLEYFENNTDYIFPILNQKHTSDQQKKDRIHKVLRKVNRDLKRIGEQIDCSINLTTYVARHTWASTLKRKGYSTEIISEGLGHAEPTTTKSYLENLSQEAIDHTDSAL